MTKVTIVDKNDNVIGAMERNDAVKQGQIVRIVRMLLFNSQGQLFIQQRSQNVNYPGLWDQSAGGHVDEGEDYITAAKRELYEEIGINDVELEEIQRYYTKYEYEGTMMRRFNTLYTGNSDQTLKLDPVEVADGKWLTVAELPDMIKTQPEKIY